MVAIYPILLLACIGAGMEGFGGGISMELGLCGGKGCGIVMYFMRTVRYEYGQGVPAALVGMNL